MVPGYTPAASLFTHRSLCPATVEPWACDSAERRRVRLARVRYCASPYPPDWSWLPTQGASDADSLSLYLPVSLVRPWCLAVPPCRYVVRAAPGLPCNSTFDLPSASRARSIGRGLSNSSRYISASWRTALIGDDLCQRLGCPHFGLRVFDLLRRGDGRFDDRRRIALVGALQGDGDHRAGFQVHRMLGFVGQVSPAIFHLRDLRVGIPRMFPVFVRCFLLA